jgi:hypothetical protein
VLRVLALALAVVMVPVAASATPLVVRLAAEASVHGDEIALSDVADVQGDGPLAERVRALRLAPAPPLGVPQALTAEAVRARLAGDAARVQLTGAARVVVMRATQTVRGADLVEAVRAATRARLASAESRGEPVMLVPIGRPEDVRVPTGELGLDARLHEGAPGAPTLAATVVVRVNGRDRHQTVLTFQFVRLVRVLVLARPLDARRALAADDFRQERRPAGEVPPDALADLAEPSD